MWNYRTISNVFLYKILDLMNTRAGKREYILQTHSTKFLWRFNRGGVESPNPPSGYAAESQFLPIQRNSYETIWLYRFYNFSLSLSVTLPTRTLYLDTNGEMKKNKKNGCHTEYDRFAYVRTFDIQPEKLYSKVNRLSACRRLPA